MHKSVVVAVESTRPHPKYKKVVKRTSRIKAHNEIEGVKVGDVVRIESGKPISKQKHFIVKEVLSKGKESEGGPKVKTQKLKRQIKKKI